MSNTTRISNDSCVANWFAIYFIANYWYTIKTFHLFQKVKNWVGKSVLKSSVMQTLFCRLPLYIFCFLDHQGKKPSSVTHWRDWHWPGFTTAANCKLPLAEQEGPFIPPSPFLSIHKPNMCRVSTHVICL